MPRPAVPAVVALLFTLLLAAPAVAAPWDLDPTFSEDGKATAAFAGESAFATDAVRLASGERVVTGDADGSIALAAFDAAGEPAEGFGEGGQTTTAVLGAFARVWSATVDLEGRIVVAGEYVASSSTGSQLLLARYDAGGILDPTFDGAPGPEDGEDGVLHTSVLPGGTATANDVLVEPDGDIVVAGSSTDVGGTSERLTMARYDDDGTLDTGFGGDGIARFEEGGMTTRAQQMVREPTGQITAVGTDVSQDNGRNILAQRVRTDGTLDTGFADGGRAVGPSGDAHAVLRQTGGRLVIAADTGGSLWRFIRLTTGGDLTNFGGQQNATVDVEMGAGGLAAPFDLLGLDGKIVATGRGYVGGVAKMALFAFTAEGIAVDRFAPNNPVFTSFFEGQASVGQALLEDPEGDGRVLAAGTAFVADAPSRFAIARYETRVPKPAATTGAATDVGETTATLGGAVQPNGSATTYRFEYGPTTAYGTLTPERQAGDGGPVSEPVTGLAASTTYHFRIVATNAGGTVRGADHTFTTTAPPPGSPPSVSTGDPTGIGPTSATFTGTVNPAGFATTYRFRYGTTTALGSETPERDAGAGTTGVERTELVEGLQPRTEYFYAVAASNENGPRLGEIRSFRTPAFPPVAITGDVTEISGPTARAAGRVNPRGTPAIFRVQYGESTEYGRETAPQAVGDGSEEVAVSAVLEGLEPYRDYHYRVVATGEGGEVFGEDRVFRSDAGAPSLLSARVTDVGTNSAVMRARVDPRGADAFLCWNVGRTPDEAHAQRCSGANVPRDGGEQDVVFGRADLAAGTDYYWEAIVRNAKGESRLEAGRFRTVAEVPLPPPPVQPLVNAGCVLDFVQPTWGGGAIHDVHAIATINPNGRQTRYSLAWKQFAGGAVSRQGGSATETLGPTAPGDYAVHLPVRDWQPAYGKVRFDVTATSDRGSGIAGGEFFPPSALNFQRAISNCEPAGTAAAATTREIGGTSELGFSTELRGVVNAGGQPTLWKFEWCYASTCGDDDRVATQAGFAADRVDRPVSTRVSTFPGSRYRYRLVTLTRAGLARGAWQEWRTPACGGSKCVGVAGLEFNVPYDNSGVSVSVSVDPSTVRKATASASAKKKNKRLVVGTKKLKRVKAGPLRVAVKLKRSARRKLARGGRKSVKARVTTVITPPRGAGRKVTQRSTVTVALRPAKARKRGR